MKILICERIKELLDDKDINAKQLALVINISDPTIYYWLEEPRNMKLSSLIVTAQALDSSLDFMIGRNEVNDGFPKTKPSCFAERLKLLIGKTRLSKVIEATQIYKSRFFDWFSGTEPKLFHLVTLSEYFACSIDYLVGFES